MRKDIAMKYNRRIFPMYKGLGWDPLFYSAIIFLFLSEVKGIDVSKIMYAESVYALFLILFQIPSAIIIERIGNRKSLILGCTLITLQIAMMAFADSFGILIIAYSLSALGNAIKEIAGNALLYDSSKVCKRKNSYGNIDAEGSSYSYIFNTISLIFAGYLYVVNPYIPIILSTLVSALTIILAYRFEDVDIEKKERTTIRQSLEDMKQGFKFVAKSKRLRALILFITVFTGTLLMILTYEKSLLKDLKVSPEYFGIIFGILTIVQCFSVRCQDKIHNRFKNKTLSFISIPVYISFIVVGIVSSSKLSSIFIMLVVAITFFIQHFLRGPYWTLENRYITNFTNSDIRTKVLSCANLVEGIGKMAIAFLGGLLLEYYSTSVSYIIIGGMRTYNYIIYIIIYEIKSWTSS